MVLASASFSYSCSATSGCFLRLDATRDTGSSLLAQVSASTVGIDFNLHILEKLASGLFPC